MSHAIHRRRAGGFTVVELLVVIAILGVLLAVLLPAAERAREKAMNVKCAANLHQIGMGLLSYANENRGRFPRTAYDPVAPLAYGTNAAASDPFRPGGPAANDVTAALFLLLRGGRVPAVAFTEPYTDELSDAPDPAADPGRRSNFTDYKRNLGYSYADPYPTAAAIAAGCDGLTTRLSATFAVMADLNPGKPGRNSRNHEGRGQNVLYADAHVVWTDTPKAGLNGDDVYSNATGVVAGPPTGPGDSVLLPVDR